MKKVLALLILILILSPAAVAPRAQVVAVRPGVEELYRLDLLPTFRRSVKVGTVSSYDRTGGNDDGFRGTHSFVRKEPGGLVIADLKGPGVVYRIWTPTPSDDIIEFYFDGEASPRLSLPLSGSLDFKRHLGRTGGYRFLLADAYAFRRSILSTIEHGPAGNKFPADYTAVTFLYAEKNPLPANTLPPPAARRVSDPERVVFTPGWNTPVHAFSWSNAVLLKADDKVGGEDLRHLSLRADGREVFGPHYISFICEMPAAGRYRVSLQAIEGPTQGVVQLFRNEVGVGAPADLYAPERRKSREIPLGELELREGDNRVMFKMVGKNPQSEGHGLDVYRIIFERSVEVGGARD